MAQEGKRLLLFLSFTRQTLHDGLLEYPSIKHIAGISIPMIEAAFITEVFSGT